MRFLWALACGQCTRRCRFWTDLWWCRWCPASVFRIYIICIQEIELFRSVRIRSWHQDLFSRCPQGFTFFRDGGPSCTAKGTSCVDSTKHFSLTISGNTTTSAPGAYGASNNAKRLLLASRARAIGSTLKSFWQEDVLEEASSMRIVHELGGGKLLNLRMQWFNTWCERVVLGKGAKVVIGESAQGTCPPHHARRS